MAASLLTELWRGADFSLPALFLRCVCGWVAWALLRGWSERGQTKYRRAILWLAIALVIVGPGLLLCVAAPAFVYLLLWLLWRRIIGFIESRRCPSCKKFWARVIDEKRLIGSRWGVKTKEVYDRPTYPGGLTGADVPPTNPGGLHTVTFHTLTRFYTFYCHCKFCGFKWEQSITRVSYRNPPVLPDTGIRVPPVISASDNTVETKSRNEH